MKRHFYFALLAFFASKFDYSNPKDSTHFSSVEWISKSEISIAYNISNSSWDMGDEKTKLYLFKQKDTVTIFVETKKFLLINGKQDSSVSLKSKRLPVDSSIKVLEFLKRSHFTSLKPDKALPHGNTSKKVKNEKGGLTDINDLFAVSDASTNNIQIYQHGKLILSHGYYAIDIYYKRFPDAQRGYVIKICDFLNQFLFEKN